ncbi:KinB-signaling pathway activation protein [Bacillus taeanensis]|uniref:KinB-signaling pathway activation protein n=1 Tax=Bacillus taeanensis TaxID=273032 RepID=A0A366XRP1_9BACI|nr:KinB-signaling pathway activation protein [Bacillus taeanensis]RBW67795.1 KinB activator protein [Bacillus taeanensis]
MNFRKWVYLFFSTLALGGLSGMITGLVIKGDLNQGIVPLLGLAVWFLGVAIIFSLISQMGFFAYLTIHRFGLGIFKSVKLWNAVQLVLVAFVLFDLVFFRYTAFAKAEETIFSYLVLPFLLLILGLIVAFIKQKQTNKQAFVPALFFMTVVTTLELFPVLRANDSKWVWIMFVPLIVSNIWQMLTLHKLTGTASK